MSKKKADPTTVPDQEDDETTATSLGFQVQRTAAGASLGQDALTEELVYMVEQLRDALQTMSAYKLLLDCERQLYVSAPIPADPKTHHRQVSALCHKADQLLNLTRILQ